MSVRFNQADHSYWCGHRQLPSVTELLRAAGLYSTYSFADPTHKYRGHAVHAGAAIIDMGGEPVLATVPKHLEQVGRDIIEGYWPAFSSWKERTGWQGRIWECSFVDPVRGFGGTFDSVGEFPDDPAIYELDVKSGVLPELVPAQLALYELLIRQGQPVDPQHPGLAWLMEAIKSGRPLKKIALRLERDGRHTMYSQTSKGRSYDDPVWLQVANSVLNLHAIKSTYGLLERTA